MRKANDAWLGLKQLKTEASHSQSSSKSKGKTSSPVKADAEWRCEQIASSQVKQGLDLASIVVQIGVGIGRIGRTE